MNINNIAVGDNVRIGKNKLVWKVVKVTAKEDSTMVNPAGIYVARPTGQHRGFSWEYLADHPLTVVK